MRKSRPVRKGKKNNQPLKVWNLSAKLPKSSARIEELYAKGQAELVKEGKEKSQNGRTARVRQKRKRRQIGRIRQRQSASPDESTPIGGPQPGYEVRK